MKFKLSILKTFSISLYLLSVNFFFESNIHASSKQVLSSNKNFDKLKIGIILPLSGSQQKYGVEALISMKIALQNFKQENPLLKDYLELVIEDDKSTVKGAQEAFSKLKTHRISILIGSVSQMISKEIALLAKKNDIPMIIPASQHMTVSQISKSTFLGCSIDKWQGRILAEFVLSKKLWHKIMILQDPSFSFSHDVGEFFKKRLIKEKDYLVSKKTYISSLFSQNIEELLEEINQDKPNLIFFPSKSIENSVLLMKGLKKRKINTTIIGTNSWHHPQLLSQSFDAANGHYYFTNFSTQIKSSKVLAFIEEFKAQLLQLSEKERLPSSLAMMSYNSIMICLESYKNAQSTHITYLTKSLLNSTAQGLLGKISMNNERFLQSSGAIFKITPRGRKLISVVEFSN